MTKISLHKISHSELENHQETCQINTTIGKISAKLLGFGFIDADTKHHVIYFPSFEISGYGNSEQEAMEMIETSFQDLLDSFLGMKIPEIQKLMKSFGWENSQIFNKRYSRLSVNSTGQLDGFNIEENSLKNVELVAA